MVAVNPVRPLATPGTHTHTHAHNHIKSVCVCYQERRGILMIDLWPPERGSGPGEVERRGEEGRWRLHGRPAPHDVSCQSSARPAHCCSAHLPVTFDVSSVMRRKALRWAEVKGQIRFFSGPKQEQQQQRWRFVGRSQFKTRSLPCSPFFRHLLWWNSQTSRSTETQIYPTVTYTVCITLSWCVLIGSWW